jgi:PKD repeat protein
MKIFKLVLLCFLLSAPVFGDSDTMFRSFPRGEVLPIKINSISPSRIQTGQVLTLIVQGENFQRKNSWQSDDIQVLKEQFVDSRTVILTVFAQGDSGRKTLNVEGGTPGFIETVNSTVLFSDNFDDGDISDWNAAKGQWTPDSGQVLVIAQRQAQLFPTLPNTDNVTIEFDLTLLTGKRAGLLFQYRDSRNFRLLMIDGKKGVLSLRDSFDGGLETKKKIPLPNPYGTSYHLLVATNNNRVNVQVNGTQFFDEDLSYVYTGQIALYAKASTARFDNVLVSHDPAADAIPLIDFTDSVVQTDVSLDASASVDPDGTIVDYTWDLGDGTQASGVTLNYHYPQNGIYGVVLKLTDNSGARTKSVHHIEIIANLSDDQAIAQVVTRFFVLLADLEFRSPYEICQDFSYDPACPARQKQIDDLRQGQPSVQWFDVEFLSNVSVSFQSATVAYPVRIRNKLWVRYFGDPATHWTDGWHVYTMHKESDGKWHQCRYFFELVAEQ